MKGTTLYLKSHHVLHAEPVHGVLVIIVGGIAMTRIEVVVHQPIANHDVAWVQTVSLLS